MDCRQQYALNTQALHQVHHMHHAQCHKSLNPERIAPPIIKIGKYNLLIIIYNKFCFVNENYFV